MTPYEFGSQIGALNKEAAIDLRGLVSSAQRAVRSGLAGARRQVPVAVRKQVRNVAGEGAKRVAAGGKYVDDLTGGRLSGAGKAVADKAVGGAKLVGSIGQVSQDAVRSGLNYADDAARYAMNGPGRSAATGGKLGDRVVRPVQTAAGQVFGTSPVGDKLNPLNLATGGAAVYGAGRATGLVGGGEPSQANIDTQQAATQAMAQQQGEANPNAAGANGGLMGMWNSLPTEARYAIGAGVPLALAGAFMGGRGNYGLGGAMGALGLGAAGLGAAGAGMFGDGARRMVGQGANALYNMVGGGGSPMDQINALGKLSPEFGTTMLMGRDPNMTSEQGRDMYDFLTHNKNIIEQLMPQLQNSSVTPVKQGSALEFGMKVARCWEGYEPVPGKKPYSNDSCRPVGSKKKKKEKTAGSSAPRGKTQMSCTPSSRGNSKPIDDRQRETNSPVPVGAGNVMQMHKVSDAYLWGAALGANLEKDAFIGDMARGIGNRIGAAGNYMQQGLNNFANSADQAGKQMYYRGARMVDKAVQPFRTAGAAVQGFGEGLVQGAKNIASIPGQVASLPGKALNVAKSYVPNVRNPFYYNNTPAKPATPPVAGAAPAAPATPAPAAT